ncbi:malate synthase A [Estrella lausannensis]|uniref:malate synthase n=1 Tax=Estrella lausannensis TaxID=483423 RepID=A0A0H5E478_9BACT|nr:malate synthase A [Estrella lausannensis]CRX38030.1 Malate synthase [Estrella lausannensis]
MEDEEIKLKPHPPHPLFTDLLNAGAIDFLSALHREFEDKREALLARRIVRQYEIDQGGRFDFPPEPASIRNDPSWSVAPCPADLNKRWVEITGPTDAKMLINALNSKADIYMADFEDSNSPTFGNIMSGHFNLKKAIRRALEHKTPKKTYRLNATTATLFVRPRGWHLPETHFFVDDAPVSASLFDFGVYLYHNAHELIKKGSAPYFYLPKMESHLEARLWQEVFTFAEEKLSLPKGTIRCTVLIETIGAAFEMEEILFELKESITGLNAGRWDYIFSIIKKEQANAELVFPDRGSITMRVPFMKAYADLLVHTCHKRGAHAMGGMSAFVPKRGDEEVNRIAFAKVREDKELEVSQGFDGTWVAHPDLVPLATEVFETKLGRDNQKDMLRNDALGDTAKLTQFTVPGGKVTLAGVRQNARISLIYLAAWLSGQGALAIDNLMEDLATCEISRAQLWQWIHRKAELEEGGVVSLDLVKQTIEEAERELLANPDEPYPHRKKLSKAKQRLIECVSSEQFIEFLSSHCLKDIF